MTAPSGSPFFRIAREFLYCPSLNLEAIGSPYIYWNMITPIDHRSTEAVCLPPNKFRARRIAERHKRFSSRVYHSQGRNQQAYCSKVFKIQPGCSPASNLDVPRHADVSIEARWEPGKKYLWFLSQQWGFRCADPADFQEEDIESPERAQGLLGNLRPEWWFSSWRSDFIQSTWVIMLTSGFSLIMRISLRIQFSQSSFCCLLHSLPFPHWGP